MDVESVESVMRAPSLDPKQYLQKHSIPQIIRSIVSGLMVQRPDDHFAYIKEKLIECQNTDDKLSLDWETFVYHLHPYRNERRLEYVHDYSRFYVEYLEKRGLDVPSLLDIESACNPYEQQPVYQPDLFKLTETVATPDHQLDG